MRNYNPPIIRPHNNNIANTATTTSASSSYLQYMSSTSSAPQSRLNSAGHNNERISPTRSRSRSQDYSYRETPISSNNATASSSRPNSTASEDDEHFNNDIVYSDSCDNDDDDDADADVDGGASTSSSGTDKDDDITISGNKKKELDTIKEETVVVVVRPPSSMGKSSTANLKLKKHKKLDNNDDDDSTCCDDDFTWVRNGDNQNSLESTTNKKSNIQPKLGGGGGGGVDGGRIIENNILTNNSNTTSSGKPPRPSGNSLDRRRHGNTTNRQERDSKSRSTHSLKENCIVTSTNSNSGSGNNSLKSEHKDRTCGGGGSGSCLVDPSYHLHRRGSPKYWELPPPPPPVPSAYSQWDQHYWNFQRSREELRMMDYHRRHHDPYRYGSNGTLNNSQIDLYGGGGCCPRYPPYQPYCLCDQRNMLGPNSGSGIIDGGRSSSSGNHQRQDTDERLRRLQTDKESLTLQVQVLSEQVSAQHERISELETKLSEKTQLMNNIEDLLHREMLSRSSLETQKLELLSAMSDLKLKQAALERENLDLRTTNLNNNNISNNSIKRPPLGANNVSGIRGMLTSTPTNSQQLPTHHGSHGSLQQNSLLAPKTPPSSSRRQIDLHYSSLPRQSFATGTNLSQNGLNTSNGGILSLSAIATPSQTNLNNSSHSSSNNNNNNSIDSNANPAAASAMTTSGTSSNKQRNVAFGKIFYDRQQIQQQPYSTISATFLSSIFQPSQPQSRLNLYQLNGFQKQRGFSVPNLAETEKVIEDLTDAPRSYTPQPTPSPLLGTKNHSNSSKGLRGIFGKLKRSNSGNLEDLPPNGTDELNFKRGGTRSTAGPRLGGWSQSQQKLNEKPFAEWDIEAVCVWLEELGLDAYESDARRWLKKGAKELVSASPVDIEKELNLKTPLHRKKIVLAVADMTGSCGDDELFRNAGKLDTNWISKWLEDVGLPQYKDVFLAARLDGRMLHKLTMDDLASLHITSMLHVASLRRGIQVMRENYWNPNCLIRRSSGEDTEKVPLWTAHRVMEWLEVIDLAEYTPNLRGAGVHGGLMVYEPKFTSELLAEMLSIPPNKTLLRRHLALHFSELIGRDIITAKRDAENTLGYVPLTITAKIKTPKKSQFSLKRKKSNTKGMGGDEWSDYVCPMGPSGDHLTTINNINTTTTTNITTNATVSMMNPKGQEHVTGSGVVSHHQLQNNHSNLNNNNNNTIIITPGILTGGGGSTNQNASESPTTSIRSTNSIS